MRSQAQLTLMPKQSALRDVDVKDVARFIRAYAKPYCNSAFGTPRAGEILDADARGELSLIRRGGLIEGVCIGGYRSRAVEHQDFAQRAFMLDKGDKHVTFLAAHTLGDVSRLLGSTSKPTWIEIFNEDKELSYKLRALGYRLGPVKITAAAEIIGLYALHVGSDRIPRTYDCDKATLTYIDEHLSPRLVEGAIEEAASCEEWADHYSYYNEKHAWNAVSLRGFKEDDPLWIIKPSEMSKKWRTENADLVKTLTVCRDTPAAHAFPQTMRLVDSIEWWRKTERVRFMRLRARTAEGKAGRLLRHSDITDRNAGTADGQVARFHIPLITNPRVVFGAWTRLGTPITGLLDVGDLWYLDQRKPHMVANAGDEDRIHLVVDVVCDDAVRAKLAKSYKHAGS